MNPYMLGSGYCSKDRDFSQLWAESLIRSTSERPNKIVILAVEEPYPYAGYFGDALWPEPTIIRSSVNLGHVEQLLSGEKNFEYCGWTSAVLALAMIAYNSGLDLVYVEEDCLLFGDCIANGYEELGEASMIFGRPHYSKPFMPCSQSFFIIKHQFLPHFVCRYVQEGNDRSIENLPEHKFVAMERQDPSKFKRFSFGYDRERSLNFDSGTFYAQKLDHLELAELKHRGML